MKIFLVILTFFVCLLTAIPLEKRQNSCNGLIITSPGPNQNDISFTNGQCYQVSWNKGLSQVQTIDTVDLYLSTGTFIQRQYRGSVPVEKLSTPYFILNLGPESKTGSFYFKINGSAPGTTCTFTSQTFKGNYNKNSQSSKCLNT
ncbi:hypothetical protein G9A89_010459 [Geosiphon pyriformis]|nr:hypothetical protein G9A89_010459 [Geosiphon pyriformis]